MRADIFLFSRGFARSRTHAAELIKNGVELQGKKITKASQDIPESTADSEIKITEPSKYVSRGGLKLEAALTAFPVDVKGVTALDVGASTNGLFGRGEGLVLYERHAARVVYEGVSCNACG